MKSPLISVEQGILYKTRGYLGGTLEFALDEVSWRTQITKALSKLGIILLDPIEDTFIGYETETKEDRALLKTKRIEGDYQFVSNYMKGVIARDLRSIDVSDFAVFKLESNRPTYGSIHELVVAEQQHKPIFLIFDDKTKIPLWLLGLIEIENIFFTVEDFIQRIEDINSGKVLFDKKKWKILNRIYR